MVSHSYPAGTDLTGSPSHSAFWRDQILPAIQGRLEPQVYATSGDLPAAGDFVGQRAFVGSGATMDEYVWNGSAWVDMQAAADAAQATADEALATANTALADIQVLMSARARGEVATAIPTTTAAYLRVSGYTEQYDVGNALDAATGFYVVPANGVYALGAGGGFATNTTGRRIAAIEKGTAAAGTNVFLDRCEVAALPSPGAPTFKLACEVQLTAGDSIALVVYQTSGGALSTSGVTYFTVRRVA